MVDFEVVHEGQAAGRCNREFVTSTGCRSFLCEKDRMKYGAKGHNLVNL